MKVRCIKIYNHITKQSQDSSSWLTIGKEYVVLAVEIRPDKVFFLIQSDHDNQPVLQDAVQFKVLSKKIPSNWKIFSGFFELINLCPKAWRSPGFWEDCYDGDSKALEIYKRELKFILEEENKI